MAHYKREGASSQSKYDRAQLVSPRHVQQAGEIEQNTKQYKIDAMPYNVPIDADCRTYILRPISSCQIVVIVFRPSVSAQVLTSFHWG